MNIKIKKCPISRTIMISVVQLAGLEPVRVASLDPKSSASANSAIAAYKYKDGAV